MIQKSNFHTHTNYCDGKNSAEEMVISAIEKGFKKIGFSGHSYTDFDDSFCMSEKATESYREEINTLKEKYKDKIEIFCGIERDYFATKKEDWDFVIGSVHYVEKKGIRYSIDESREAFISAANEGYGGDFYAMAEDYYALLSQIKEVAKADIVGHFDIITKFNENGDLFDENHPRYEKAAFSALSTLLEKDVIFEINTGAQQRGYRSVPYPSKKILSAIYKAGGKVLISSDCHEASALDFGFYEATNLAKEVGFRAFAQIK